MTTTPRWLCAVLVVAVAFTGPLGALSLATPAAAQTTSTTTTYSGERAPEITEPTEGDRIGAGFMNVVFVPGKAIVCSVGTLASVTLMLLTFGFGYSAARELFMEGCSGDWVLTPEHLSGKEPLRPDVNQVN